MNVLFEQFFYFAYKNKNDVIELENNLGYLVE